MKMNNNNVRYYLINDIIACEWRSRDYMVTACTAQSRDIVMNYLYWHGRSGKYDPRTLIPTILEIKPGTYKLELWRADNLEIQARDIRGGNSLVAHTFTAIREGAPVCSRTTTRMPKADLDVISKTYEAILSSADDILNDEVYEAVLTGNLIPGEIIP